MADNLVTQVDENGETVPPVRRSVRRSWKTRLLSFLQCCRPQHHESSMYGDILHSDPGHNLLPRKHQCHLGRKCLVLDLDETLVHSSFKPVEAADFVIPIQLEGVVHYVYVMKRPYVDEFLDAMGKVYETVMFTASLSTYADAVVNLLDSNNNLHHRLFREHCVFERGVFVKDLERLGRDVNQSIIVDNSPVSYAFQPNNAIPIPTWIDDPHDTYLRDLIPFLLKLAQVDDIYSKLEPLYTTNLDVLLSQFKSSSIHSVDIIHI
eukprot:m.12876 g.12876  ORF g.12876 m.12876 type:complete len:264 (+) comp4074_c0_seq2:94-885(+)